MTNLEIKLTALSWSKDAIKEEIIDTYHECIESFLRCEDDSFNDDIESIIEENFGMKCKFQELEQAYNNVNKLN